MSEKPLTPYEEKVLAALPIYSVNARGLSASRVAEIVWPDAKGWGMHHKCGPNGTTRGSAMPQIAGRFLHSLQRRGLVTHERGGWFKYRSKS